MYFFRREDIRVMLEKAGFEPVDWTTAGKHVSIGFALSRLGAYVRGLDTLARLAGNALQRTVYVDPLDKMHVIARR